MNSIYTPALNPDIFYSGATVSAPYLTKHIDQFSFLDRGRPWLQNGKFRKIWMTSDIKRGQFSSTFDPVLVELVNQYNIPVITLPALAGIANKFFPGTHIFEFEMSLADLETGCYRMKRTLGSGDTKQIEYGDWEYISSTPIKETILIEYWSSKDYDKDVVFKTGIRFQLRVPGFIDYDKTGRNKKKEDYRNQKYTNVRLSSKSVEKVPVYFGMTPTSILHYGLPSEITNLIELIFELDNVTLDGKAFSLPEEFEYTDDKGFRLRGMSASMEPRLNRYSRVREIDVDPNKRIIMGAMADVRVLGDTSGQGSTNAVPFEQTN
jgi:hypothetical protein